MAKTDPKQFTLSSDNQIRGDQLEDEIRNDGASPNTVDTSVVFYPPLTAQIIGVEDGEEAAVQAVVTAHVPLYPYFPEDYEQQVEQESINKASAIPNWSTWTEIEGLTWHDTNIKDPLETLPDIDGLTPAQFNSNAQAIMVVMQDVLNKVEAENRAIVRLIIALRNKSWPSLEGS